MSANPYKGGGTAWTEEEDTRLRQLVSENLSGAKIGARLQRSRNAVIGRAFRLGLSLKGQIRKARTPKPRLKRGAPTQANKERIAILRKKAEERAANQPPSVDPWLNAKRFIDVMGEPVCKWFMPGHDGLNGLVCAEPQDAGSYCLHHSLKAYGHQPRGERVKTAFSFGAAA